MPVALVVIGVILIIVAFNNTMGQLATELQNDVPGFFVWGAAIAIILGLGYVPGLRTPSRWLLALVVLVIVLTQYKKIIDGFSSFAASGGKTTGVEAADPAATFASSPAGKLPTAAQVGGDAPGVPGGALPGGIMGMDLGSLLGGGGFGSMLGGIGGGIGGGVGGGFGGGGSGSTF
jgi:hypothetical protein